MDKVIRTDEKHSLTALLSLKQDNKLNVSHTDETYSFRSYSKFVLHHKSLYKELLF